MTLLGPGDECLVPLPGFPNYYQSVSLVGATPISYICRSESGFLPSMDDIESKTTSKTKCIVLCNPSNPTGAALPTAFVRDIMAFARSKGIYVISDEIYSEIMFDQEHACAARFENHDEIKSALPGEESNLAVVSGMSKAFSMTGFRVGWTRCSPQLAAVMTKIQEPMVSCGTSFTQYASITALTECENESRGMVKEYHTRRDAALAVLKTRGRASFIPGGAFYLPLDISSSGMPALDFALKLLAEKHVAVAPGTAFDTGGSSGVMDAQRIEELLLLNSFVRVSLANSQENVVKGVSAICDLLDELQKSE